MSKAEAGMKLVRWLPQIAEAAADDIARFGPNAARVRGLLDFVRNMSDDAAIVAKEARLETGAKVKDAMSVADTATQRIRGGAEHNAWEDAQYLSRIPGMGSSRFAARDAALAEVNSDLLSGETYRAITNPLAAGRAFDVLRPRAPENFLDVVRGLSERRLVTQPIDVLGARTLARAPKSEREALMEVINAIAGDTGYADTGYGSLAELIEAARLLG